MSQGAADPVGCGGSDTWSAPESVLAAALEAYVSIDAAGRVLAWNPAAEATFGYDRQQACGAHIEDLIIPERFRQAHRAGLAAVAAGGAGRVLGKRLQLPARHRDGHEFPVELTLTATYGPAGPRFHAFAHDITAAHRAQRFTAAEAAVAHGLARAGSSAEAAIRVVEALGVQLGWPVVELWLVDEARQVLTCPARYVTAELEVPDFAVDELEYGLGVPGLVCRDRRPMWVPDLAAEPGLLRSRAAARHGLHVAVGVPIASGAHVLGALAVYGHAVEDPEDSLTGLLGGLAAHVGQFLERRRAEELVVELARTKDEFLAMVTHELRNPLAIITGTAGLLRDELDDLTGEQQRQYLDTIARSAGRLAAMSADLLDLSRIEAGHLALDPHPTDLGELLRQAVDAVLPALTAKQLRLTLDLSHQLSLHADPVRLRQVADNLLSNAIKYTPAGGAITVTAHPDHDAITWTVTDTGIGIPAAERPRLFRRFYRASTAIDQRIPGTGLGLVIARTIIERHHGTITVADAHGPGTTFTIQLPVKPPA